MSTEAESQALNMNFYVFPMNYIYFVERYTLYTYVYAYVCILCV